VLAVEQLPPAQQVDRTVLRGGHEPGSRVVRDARLRPPLEGDDEGVLREVLGQADAAHDPREAGDEPRRLDSPDGGDRAMGIGSRHGYRSEHSGFGRARRGARSAGRYRVCQGLVALRHRSDRLGVRHRARLRLLVPQGIISIMNRILSPAADP
jgi:hypothetical protein